MVIDKRKNHYLIFDTETAGKQWTDENKIKHHIKHIYDFGYIIATKQEILLKRNYVVNEVFNNMELMQNAYYIDKKPLYDNLILHKQLETKNYIEIIDILQKDLQKYNVKFACAYNIGFDLDACRQTMQLIYPNSYQTPFIQTPKGKWRPNNELFFERVITNKTIKILDIWTMACLTLCQQKTFQTHYLELGKNGQIRSNAEKVYNYITDQKGEFKEEHTALSDSIIEYQILQRILRQHKKLKSVYEFMPSRLIQKVV